MSAPPPAAGEAGVVRRLTCREAARLLFGAVDSGVSQGDQASLEAHIRICEACVRVQSQASFMREALGAWRRYRDAVPDGADADAPPRASPPAPPQS